MGERVTTKEASKILGISEHSLTIMRKQGLLPYLKVGMGRGHILYDIEKLTAALEVLEEQNQERQRAAYDEYMSKRYPVTEFQGKLLKGRG